MSLNGDNSPSQEILEADPQEGRVGFPHSSRDAIQVVNFDIPLYCPGTSPGLDRHSTSMQDPHNSFS